MLKEFFALALAIAVLMLGYRAFHGQEGTANRRDLKSAIEGFNEAASRNLIGKAQPPLTEEEVVSAIRGWQPELTPGATDSIYEQFQKIAESGELPEGAELKYCTGWTGYRGYHFQVWWVDLSIKTGERTGFTFRIRNQFMKSRKITPQELANIKSLEGTKPSAK